MLANSVSVELLEGLLMSQQSSLTYEDIQRESQEYLESLPTLEELERQYASNEIDEFHYWDIKSHLLPDDEEVQIKAAEFIMAA